MSEKNEFIEYTDPVGKVYSIKLQPGMIKMVGSIPTVDTLYGETEIYSHYKGYLKQIGTLENDEEVYYDNSYDLIEEHLKEVEVNLLKGKEDEVNLLKEKGKEEMEIGFKNPKELERLENRKKQIKEEKEGKNNRGREEKIVNTILDAMTEEYLNDNIFLIIGVLGFVGIIGFTLGKNNK